MGSEGAKGMFSHPNICQVLQEEGTVGKTFEVGAEYILDRSNAPYTNNLGVKKAPPCKKTWGALKPFIIPQPCLQKQEWLKQYSILLCNLAHSASHGIYWLFFVRLKSVGY